MFCIGRLLSVWLLLAVSAAVLVSTCEAQRTTVDIKKVRKLDDQAALIDIAKNDRDADVRAAAVEKVTDQVVVADVAKNDSDARVRMVAVGKLSDQSVLTEMVKSDIPSVRAKAAAKLMSKYVLRRVGREDADPAVRDVAIARYTSLPCTASASPQDIEAWRSSTGIRMVSRYYSGTVLESRRDGPIEQFLESAILRALNLPRPESSEPKIPNTRKYDDTFRASNVGGPQTGEVTNPAAIRNMGVVRAPDLPEMSTKDSAIQATLEYFEYATPLSGQYISKDGRRTAWTGASAKVTIRLTLDDQCIYSGTSTYEERLPSQIPKGSYANVSDAPVYERVMIARSKAMANIVRLVSGESELGKIAKDVGVSRWWRLGAMVCVTDQTVLFEVADNDNETEAMRRSAVDLLTDRPLLIKLAGRALERGRGMYYPALERLNGRDYRNESCLVEK